MGPRRSKLARRAFCFSIALAFCSCIPGRSGRFECPPERPSGGKLIDRADLIILGEVLEITNTGERSTRTIFTGEIFQMRKYVVKAKMKRVLKQNGGPTPQSDSQIHFFYWNVYGAGVVGEPTGLPEGIALIPLRIVGKELRTICDCQVPTIPLDWWPSNIGPSFPEPEGYSGIADILLGPAPIGHGWPIAGNSVSIVNELLGPLETSNRLIKLVPDRGPTGGGACIALCMDYGQCACAKSEAATELARGITTSPSQNVLAVRDLKTRSLISSLRAGNWDYITGITRSANRAEAIRMMARDDSKEVRELARRAAAE